MAAIDWKRESEDALRVGGVGYGGGGHVVREGGVPCCGVLGALVGQTEAFDSCALMAAAEGGAGVCQ